MSPLAQTAAGFVVFAVCIWLTWYWMRNRDKVKCAICGQRLPRRDARLINPIYLPGSAHRIAGYYIHKGRECPPRR